MASGSPTSRTADSLVEAIGAGRYPDDEELISSELQSDAVINLAELLERARAEVKASIRELSKLSAPDVDGWISQARRLREDISDSQSKATRIISYGKEEEQKRLAVQDAAGKVDLLNNEVTFNKGIAVNLMEARRIQMTIRIAENAIKEKELNEAIHILGEARSQLGNKSGSGRTRLVELLETRSSKIQTRICATLRESWSTCVIFDEVSYLLEIRRVSSGSSIVPLDDIVSAMYACGLLDEQVRQFSSMLQTRIIRPWLRSQTSDKPDRIRIHDDILLLSEGRAGTPVSEIFSDLEVLVNYLLDHLPHSFLSRFSTIFMPVLIGFLTGGPLAHAVPVEIDEMSHLIEIAKLAESFGEILQRIDWTGQEDISQWKSNLPKIWLDRRKEDALHTLRRLLMRGVGAPRAVERVETQVVSQDEQIFNDRKGNDDWNANWSDNENEESQLRQSGDDSHVQQKGDVDARNGDEDTSAWDFDDEQPAGNPSEGKTEDEDNDGEAWGWGDEDEQQSNSPGGTRGAQEPVIPRAPNNANGLSKIEQNSTREVTLRESYSITALPEQILELIMQNVADAQTLSQQGQESNPVASAAIGLLNLPGVLLTMYRAIAPNFYSSNISGNMFLYNDSLYMSEQLRNFAQSQYGHGVNSDLSIDVSVLDLYGKRAYGREMDSQRTIIGDFLDGAQGFVQSTEHPMAQECDIAISSAVDRIRDLHTQWKGVLSHSALLQSIGSLLSTVINKLILDIEDMGDISEPESQRLASFCNRVALLENLFVPQQQNEQSVDGRGQEQRTPLTAIYTPYWLRFQYLANILESSLVDIKYLWTEGELSLEFGNEEVVDLIEALFADSEHRRRAIAEIRRTRH